MANPNPRYAANPFAKPTVSRSATVYRPDAYVLSQLCTLSPDSLRVLLVFAAHVDPVSGKSTVTTLALRPYLARHASNVRRAVAELIRQDFISRANQAHTYYINPKAFRPISIEL